MISTVSNAAVLQVLSDDGWALTTTQIAARTRMPVQTVEDLTAALLRSGLVTRTRQRRVVAYRINMDGMRALHDNRL